MNHFFAAFRPFRHSPGFAITIVLTLALGIGANTAIFTLVHAVLLRSLPVSNPNTLFRVGSDTTHAGIMGGLPEDDNFSLFPLTFINTSDRPHPHSSNWPPCNRAARDSAYAPADKSRSQN